MEVPFLFSRRRRRVGQRDEEVEDQQLWGLQSIYPTPQGKLPVMLTKELSRRIGSLDAAVGRLAKLYLLYCEHRRTSHSAENLRLAGSRLDCRRQPLIVNEGRAAWARPSSIPILYSASSFLRTPNALLGSVTRIMSSPFFAEGMEAR